MVNTRFGAKENKKVCLRLIEINFETVQKMSKTHPPELKKYMDKEMELKLNGNRRVSGVLRGFDPFMNMVIEDAIEYPKNGDPISLGMVVIRGNSVVIMEPKERIC
nr:Like-Sm ribonucleoprotein domain containing protein [Haemonchus contortus]